MSPEAKDLAPPHRRLRLVLDLEADNFDALGDALRVIADDADIDGWPVEQTSGGYESGYHLTLFDQGDHVTHDSFRAALLEWLEARRVIDNSPEVEAHQ